MLLINIKEPEKSTLELKENKTTISTLLLYDLQGIRSESNRSKTLRAKNCKKLQNRQTVIISGNAL